MSADAHEQRLLLQYLELMGYSAEDVRRVVYRHDGWRELVRLAEEYVQLRQIETSGLRLLAQLIGVATLVVNDSGTVVPIWGPLR